MPLMDWLRGVDAWPGSPQHRASSEASGDSSADLDDKGEDKQMSYVHEKVRGKRPASEEPSLKSRKIAGSSHHEERPMSIGATA